MISAWLLLAAAAQTPEAILLTDSASPYANYGESVATQGDWTFVGAPDDYLATNYEGSVYAFHRTAQGWVEHAKLISSQPASFANFGHDIAVDGDVLVIGAPGPLGTGIGSAHVYRFNGQDWIEEQILQDSTGWGNDWFGWSVDVDGDRIAVGAMWAHQPVVNWANHAGAAWVYKYNGQAWVLEQELVSSDQESYDNFGSAVALSGDRLVVGARGEGNYFGAGGNNEYAIGAAYVFDYVGGAWVEQQKLRASIPEENSYFGGHVAADNNTLLIGSFGRNGGISHGSGAAYFFELQGGNWVETLHVDGMMPGYTHALGRGVAIDGDLAVIASGGHDLLGNEQGAVHPYRRVNGVWQPEPLINPGGMGRWDLFAQDVDLHGEQMATCAYLESLSSAWSPGGGFVYQIPPRFHLIGAPLPLDIAEDAKLTLRNGAPHTRAWLAYSLAGPGTTSVPALGVVLDLAQAKQLGNPRRTNGSGEVKWDLVVPSIAQGLTIWLQGLQAGQTTNLIRSVVQ